MAAQQEISAAILAARVGREIEVIVDAVDQENDETIARSKWDAPEIDGNVFLPGERGLKPGDLAKVRVVEAEDYDLIAEIT
jgi:ribosomal protein S12 methylthiotransferase